MSKSNYTGSAIDEVREYWNSHLNLTQFLDWKDVHIDSEYFYREIEQHVRARHSYKEKLLKDFALGCQGQKLLEVGCGLGVELAWLGRFGFDVTGIDLAPAAVTLAAEHLRRVDVCGQTVVQNVEQMDFPDNSFDAVYSSGVLHHTPDIKKAIAEILRVLKPGGKVLVILYHRHSWLYFLHKLTGINIEFGDEDAPIINAYTRRQAKSLFHALRSCSMDLQYCYPTPTKKPGLLAFLFNHVFVPGSKMIPPTMMRELGWHLVVTGVK